MGTIAVVFSYFVYDLNYIIVRNYMSDNYLFLMIIFNCRTTKHGIEN